MHILEKSMHKKAHRNAYKFLCILLMSFSNWDGNITDWICTWKKCWHYGKWNREISSFLIIKCFFPRNKSITAILSKEHIQWTGLHCAISQKKSFEFWNKEKALHLENLFYACENCTGYEEDCEGTSKEKWRLCCSTEQKQEEESLSRSMRHWGEWKRS